MIWRAIGAAVWPPVEVWFSSATATATFGASAGAKQMNHVVLRCVTPVSAVPVLPATLIPGICALVPEREPARVDLVVVLRVEELAVPVEAARAALVRRRLEGRDGIEAEALR